MSCRNWLLVWWPAGPVCYICAGFGIITQIVEPMPFFQWRHTTRYPPGQTIKVIDLQFHFVCRVGSLVLTVARDIVAPVRRTTLGRIAEFLSAERSGLRGFLQGRQLAAPYRLSW